jgi:hypothetical protein
MTETSGPTTFTETLTYTLNSDCSATLTAMRSTGTTAHSVITVTDNGSKVERRCLPIRDSSRSAFSITSSGVRRP